MKRCPRCSHARAYLLSDGRRKCRRCGQRYSWTSAWDSIRLPETVKRRLLEHFIVGVPAYRLKQHSGVSLKSNERFNRVLRACCASSEGITADLCVAEVYAKDSPDLRGVTFGLVERGGRVTAMPELPGRRELPAAAFERYRQQGPLEPAGPNRARVTLLLRGNRVLCASPDLKSRRTGAQAVFDEFCRFAMEWLQPFGTLRREYFHLYIGEICYRFNRRRTALAAGLMKQLRATSIQQLRPLLDRKG
jgi:transposase